MNTNFVHNINPVIMKVCGIELYYYGLAYAIGFAGIFGWLAWRRDALGWNRRNVYDFSILFSTCVLLCGRLFSVLVYHRSYYWQHPLQLFAYWKGGMATHGVLLGAVLAIFIYSRWQCISFRQLADEIVIPAAFLLALGRVGNFMNGQICGTVTNVWWAVKFPGLDGFRHPVTLYEAIKNLMIIPILLIVSRRAKAKRGLMAAHFIFWYGFLRLFTDIFRDHGATWLGIGVNQYYNALMGVAGLVLMIVFMHSDRQEQRLPVVSGTDKNKLQFQQGPVVSGMWIRRIVLTAIIVFSMVIRSAWTPQVLEQRRMQHVAASMNADDSETAQCVVSYSQERN